MSNKNIVNAINEIVNGVNADLDQNNTRQEIPTMQEAIVQNEKKLPNVDKLTKAKIIELLGEQMMLTEFWMAKAKAAEDQLNNLTEEVIAMSKKLEELQQSLENTQTVNSHLIERATPSRMLKPMNQMLWEMVSGKEPIHYHWFEVEIREMNENTIEVWFEKDYYQSDKTCQSFLAFIHKQMTKHGHICKFTKSALRITRGQLNNENTGGLPEEEPTI